MNIRGRAIFTRMCVSSVIAIMLASMTMASFAQTPAKSLKDELVGHWQLVSVSINNTQPYGGNPQGAMFLDADGHYSVIVLTAGNARNISFFGTYTVDNADNSMTMHVVGSSLANASGRDEKRLVSFSGDELIQTAPKGAIKLTWKRS